MQHKTSCFVFRAGDIGGNLPPGFSCVLAAFLFDAIAFIVIGVTRDYSREESAEPSDDKIFWFVDTMASSL